MSALYKNDDGSYAVYGGCGIKGAIAEAVETAKKVGQVSFEFNGVEVRVVAASDPELIYRDWSRALDGSHDGPVGPFPAGSLTEAERQHDADVQAANERRRQKSANEMRARDKARADALEAELGDAKGWTPKEGVVLELGEWVVKNSADPYSFAVVKFIRSWGALMEKRMASGRPLSEVAGQASHDADTEGITGFMYGCAVGALAHFWVHGEELRRWSNLTLQVGNEGEKANESGGVLNPALITIGREE